MTINSLLSFKMAGIPGGMENYSDEDDLDCMVYDFSAKDSEDLTRKLNAEGNLRPLDSSSIPSRSSVHHENLSKPQNGLTGKAPVKESMSVGKGQKRQPLFGSVVVDDFRMAAISGNLKKVQELLDQGLEVDTVLKSSWTCLMYACSCAHFQIVKFLLENNADPNYQKGMFTPLLAVCASRQDKEEDLLKCLQILLEYGANVNDWDRHHMTGLMFCARENRTTMLQALIMHQVEVDKQDHRGWTALFWAASNGHGQSVRILLEGGSDPNKIATDGQSAADVAYAQKHEEIAEILEQIRSQKVSQLNDSYKESLQNCRKGRSKQIQDYGNSQKKQCTVYGELEMFLSGLNLSEYIPLFHDHKISFFDFLLLTDEDLEKMGINKVGIRKNILDGIKTVHTKKWEKSSLPNLRKQQYISCPDAVAMMANISNHLRYIKSTVRYLRNQIQKTPRILELGQEAANVHKLLEESTECIQNEKILFDELRFFKLYLEKIQDHSAYQPADLIVERVSDKKQETHRLSKVAMIGVTVVLCLIVWKKSHYLTGVVIQRTL